ncbi:hypothetical protein EYF80_030993 [Liparis tanakae]|uniref:Uncharacterized protein n=1 Tax=Liparis tanakae TaxID=230148 RepID=A0A4Z2H1Z5_9TELE|nr:hypothetical protein EYF80_030993 [Liparis tanakae]
MILEADGGREEEEGAGHQTQPAEGAVEPGFTPPPPPAARSPGRSCRSGSLTPVCDELSLSPRDPRPAGGVAAMTSPGQGAE